MRPLSFLLNVYDSKVRSGLDGFLELPDYSHRVSTGSSSRRLLIVIRSGGNAIFVENSNRMRDIRYCKLLGCEHRYIGNVGHRLHLALTLRKLITYLVD